MLNVPNWHSQKNVRSLEARDNYTNGAQSMARPKNEKVIKIIFKFPPKFPHIFYPLINILQFVYIKSFI